MVFNSIEFLIFFPIVTFIFFLIPRKLRSLWLLISSYYFYMSWNPKYAILIAVSTLITYLSGILLSETNTRGGLSEETRTLRKKIIVGISFISNLGILFVFKYANFLIENICSIMNAAGIEIVEKPLDLLLPVGISFYTFQALSYTMDVYRGEIEAEKNPIKYALFVSFFPQLVAGPIERSTKLLPQINDIAKKSKFSYKNAKSGLLLMLWGLFQKLVIADRAAILVNAVYNNYKAHSFASIALATVCFAFQVYCDFDGYTNIARGASKVLGIKLMKNFRQPYFATNIRDFWRRWHISLTTWFTDYLYIPLGGNRKGLGRQLINILIIFTVSGLWHGASWNYVVWGMLHALYQCICILKRKISGHNTEKTPGFLLRLIKILITFALTDFAWIFFRASSLSEAIGIIKQMITNFTFTLPTDIGLNKINLLLLLASLVILFLVDLCHEKNIRISKIVFAWPKPVRFIFYLAFIWTIIMFGIYGVAYTSSQFIYFQF